MGADKIQDAVPGQGNGVHPFSQMDDTQRGVVCRGAAEVAEQVEYTANVEVHLQGSQLHISPGASIARNGRRYDINPLWPHTQAVMELATWSIDEGHAGLLTALVRIIQPKVILETGTHRGRSTQALIDGMSGTHAHLYTVDLKDWGFQCDPQYVHKCIGPIPEILAREELADIGPIGLAVLDASHDYQGLDAEFAFVKNRAADRCWIVMDNTDDPGWPEVRQWVEDRLPNALRLPTLNGAVLAELTG